ncbi:MAG: metalloregulator ArsR/SmtB family transcription factor [Lachnospiraceae bacterium]|nr:metalloregulator ArsR/SmtB family transcription factor [Lachnospiraceae bacterium]
MTELQAIGLFKCLADKSRIQILKSLMTEDMYVERLSERLNLTPATISFHLKKLVEAGAVKSRKEQYYTIYAINGDVFNVSILDILKEQSEEKQLLDERDEAYRRKVIEAFFEYGKLKSIPSQRKKELIVLKEIAKAFEPGRDYTEREVNLVIAEYHDDFCTIRRDMIVERLLTRENGIYRKA